MKIYAILDHPGYNRTLLGVIEKWKQAGHEVKIDMYYDVEKAAWCDIIFGEYIQGGIIPAVKDENANKPIVIRGIDIDLYFGHMVGIDWDKCKAVLFINNYMKEYSLERYRRFRGEPTCPVEVVNLGVDIDKLTYRDRKPGKTIGWLNRIGSGKGIELLCQIIYKMVKYSKDYKFEIVGQCNTAWLMKYLIEFLNRNGLNDNVKIMPEVVNVNEWMDSIDYIMSTSMKECMSLPLAEGMAKGIKPVIHNWWGADELYPGDLIFQTAEQACDIIMSQQYDSNFYRKFVEDKYTLNMQVNKLNKIMGL